MQGGGNDAAPHPPPHAAAGSSPGTAAPARRCGTRRRDRGRRPAPRGPEGGKGTPRGTSTETESESEAGRAGPRPPSPAAGRSAPPPPPMEAARGRKAARPPQRGFLWRGPCLKKKGIGRQSSCWSSTCFRVLTPFLSRISQRKPSARYGRVSRRTPARLRLEAPQEATSFSHPSTATQSRVGCPAPCSGDFWRSPKRRLLHLSGQPVPGHH